MKTTRSNAVRMAAPVVVLILYLFTVYLFAAEESPKLANIRQLVAKNEALFSRIKLTYTTKVKWAGPPLSHPSPMVKAGPPYSHYRCVWAQDQNAGRYYLQTDNFLSATELANRNVLVVGGKKIEIGRQLPMREWKVTTPSKLEWGHHPIDFWRLGPRPFEGEHLLSELLVPEHSSVRDRAERVNGREAYVIDSRRPAGPAYFARIWIDAECSVPLRLEYYNEPASIGLPKNASVDSIKLHQLPNGGWIPTEGQRTVYFKQGPATCDIKVDVSTITIQSDDIRDTFSKATGLYRVPPANHSPVIK